MYTVRKQPPKVCNFAVSKKANEWFNKQKFLIGYVYKCNKKMQQEEKPQYLIICETYPLKDIMFTNLFRSKFCTVPAKNCTQGQVAWRVIINEKNNCKSILCMQTQTIWPNYTTLEYNMPAGSQWNK